MRFGFIAKHRGIWPAEWLCGALGVSRGGFYGWLTRPRSQRSRSDEDVGAKVRASFLASDRTYGARRVWHDLLAEGVSCGLHRIERLMRLQALKARPRRRRLPPDLGERQATAVAANVLDRSFEAAAPNRKWIADFTYVWTAEVSWLCPESFAHSIMQRLRFQISAVDRVAAYSCSTWPTTSFRRCTVIARPPG
jgi:putative transposase